MYGCKEDVDVRVRNCHGIISCNLIFSSMADEAPKKPFESKIAWTRGCNGTRPRNYYNRGKKPANKAPPMTEEEQEKMKQRSMRFDKKDEPVRQQYGFVSRGEDDRLQKSDKHRRTFFSQILASFAAYCSQTNMSDDLSKRLAKLTINESELAGIDRAVTDDKTKTLAVTIDSILTSLRKLREALIHTKVDDFSKEVFLFSIRISANIGHYQTYIPSINFLLDQNIDKLTKEETREIATLLILHVLHFNRDFNLSIRLFYKYLDAEKDQKILSVITSYMVDDYYTWTKLYNAEVDSSVLAMMRYGVKHMVQLIIDCFTSSYFNMDVHELERFLPNGVVYETLAKEYKAPWVQNGDNIVIRQRKR